MLSFRVGHGLIDVVVVTVETIKIRLRPKPGVPIPNDVGYCSSVAIPVAPSLVMFVLYPEALIGVIPVVAEHEVVEKIRVNRPGPGCRVALKLDRPGSRFFEDAAAVRRVVLVVYEATKTDRDLEELGR